MSRNELIELVMFSIAYITFWTKKYPEAELTASLMGLDRNILPMAISTTFMLIVTIIIVVNSSFQTLVQFFPNN